MGYSVFVFGPAGSGKTTFCKQVLEHGKVVKRNFILVNLDPAQIANDIEYSIDIRDYITINDVMEECDYGPNGGLMVALEELYENIDELGLVDFQESFLVFDCPGQIELFMHSDVMSNIMEYVQKYFKIGILYLLEAQYTFDINKYLGGCLCAFITMARYNFPIQHVLTKMNMVAEVNKDIFSRIKGSKFSDLNNKIAEFLEDNGMLDFKHLDWSSDDDIEEILYFMDTSLQYYDDQEVRQEKD